MTEPTKALTAEELAELERQRVSPLTYGDQCRYAEALVENGGALLAMASRLVELESRGELRASERQGVDDSTWQAARWLAGWVLRHCEGIDAAPLSTATKILEAPESLTPSQPAPSADAAMAELESALQFVICFDGFEVLNESCPGEPMYCAKIDDYMSQTKPSVGEAVVALAIEIGWEMPLPAPPGGGK